MRKIESLTKEAFNNNKDFQKDNTTVHTNSEGWTMLRLHGNLIAAKEKDGKIKITTAGWQTNTTLSRLRNVLGADIRVKKGQMYLNGVKWDGELKEI